MGPERRVRACWAWPSNEGEAVLSGIDAALDALIDAYLADACPCRFPRFRAVVSFDSSPRFGASYTTREQRSLIAAYDARVPVEDRAAFGPSPEGRQGKCAICGSRVERSSSEDGVQFLVIRAAPGVVDVGAPVEHGQILRATDFEAVGRGSSGAGQLALVHPCVGEAAFLSWMRARRDPKANSIHRQAEALANAIEAELKAIGRWSDTPPSPEQIAKMGAFGMNGLFSEQWLQFVLVPRVRAIAVIGGEFPSKSSVGVWAVRNFDGDRDAGHLTSLLCKLDALIDDGLPSSSAQLENAAAQGNTKKMRKLLLHQSPVTAEAFCRAVSAGIPENVRLLLDAGADPLRRETYGISPLFFAAAGGHAALASFLADPDGTDLHDARSWRGEPATEGHLEIAAELLARGADVNEHDKGGGATPLIVATAFGNDAIAQLFTENRASAALTDGAGRTASDWRVLRVLVRLRHILANVPSVESAYLAQFYFPGSRQYTPPLVGVVLDGPLPADAFAGIPARDAMVAMQLGDDAVSRLMRLGAPFYSRKPGA